MTYLVTPPQRAVYLAQANWYIDPSLGNDQYDGTSASFVSGKVGPIKTWAELVKRWGTSSPTINQNTTITFVSSHTDNSDPVTFTPIFNGTWAILQGTPHQVATATLSGVTSINRSTPQLQQANLGASGAAGLLVQNNTTSHDSQPVSCAWAYKPLGGNLFSLTTPAAAQTPPSVSGLPQEVQTWANGDSVVLYSLTNINILKLNPSVSEYGASSGLFVYRCNIFDPDGAGSDDFYMGKNTILLESAVQRAIVFDGVQNTDTNVLISNVFNQGGILASDTAGFGIVIAAGATLNNSYSVSVANGEFARGHILGGDADGYVSISKTYMLDVYIESGTIVNMTDFNYTAGLGMWGLGSIQLLYNATLRLLLNSFATNVLQIKGHIYLNGLTTAYACDSTGDPVVIHPNRILSAAAIDTPVANGGFGGTAYNPGGASISNIDILNGP